MSEFRPSRFEILPLVIKNLLIINGLIYLAQYTAEQMGQGKVVDDLFALHYWGSDLFRPHQLLTHLFMHGSFAHLFSNMFTLWMFGAMLENVWGPKRFLIFYMVCGLGAALCHMGVLTYENMSLAKDAHQFLNDPTYVNYMVLDRKYDLDSGRFIQQGVKEALYYNPTPEAIETAKIFIRDFVASHRDEATLGASGAVFGILFAFGYLFPNMYLYMYFLFPVKAKYFVAGMIILELISGFQNTAGDNVAHFAHLGGVLFSYLMLRTWSRKNRQDFY
jgi:membrane associated rhomboid family serine protease